MSVYGSPGCTCGRTREYGALRNMSWLFPGTLRGAVVSSTCPDHCQLAPALSTSTTAYARNATLFAHPHTHWALRTASRSCDTEYNTTTHTNTANGALRLRPPRPRRRPLSPLPDPLLRRQRALHARLPRRVSRVRSRAGKCPCSVPDTPLGGSTSGACVPKSLVSDDPVLAPPCRATP